MIISNQPVISVDTKKKELVGDYKNGGREWHDKGQPVKVKVHDFVDPAKGKAVPYGVYDVANNQGWVNVGQDHDTSAFAVESIRRWWLNWGSALYPQSRSLLICADGGGSNGCRGRLWKKELQKFADETGLEINVCHLPPGTSKWNKIEHRLFSHSSINWRGKPLTSHEVTRVMADFKRHTARRILAQLEAEHCDWLLHELRHFCAGHHGAEYQLWQVGFHPQAIVSDEMMEQKMAYLHNNLVKRGLVASPEHWRYSSAHAWCAGTEPVLQCDEWR